jgi:hypothetical protein
MALDVAKGFVPALLATIYVGHLAGVLAGGAAMLGHWRPLFLGFARGGKVVATCGGAFLGVAPVVGGIEAAVWILVFALCRYAPVSSIIAALSLPVTAVALGEPWPVDVFAGIAALAVLVLHRAATSRHRDALQVPAPSLSRLGAREPFAKLGLARRRLAAVELAAQLGRRAVALRDHVVRMDRLQVHLPREQEVRVVELRVLGQRIA